MVYENSLVYFFELLRLQNTEHVTVHERCLSAVRFIKAFFTKKIKLLTT